MISVADCFDGALRLLFREEVAVFFVRFFFLVTFFAFLGSVFRRTDADFFFATFFVTFRVLFFRTETDFFFAVFLVPELLRTLVLLAERFFVGIPLTSPSDLL